MAGVQRGTTRKLIGVEGNDGIVKLDDSRDYRIGSFGKTNIPMI